MASGTGWRLPHWALGSKSQVFSSYQFQESRASPEGSKSPLAKGLLSPLCIHLLGSPATTIHCLGSETYPQPKDSPKLGL